MSAEGRPLISSTHTPFRFSNRPFGVKRFQTIHRYSVAVAYALASLRHRHQGPSIMGFEDEVEQSCPRRYRQTDGWSKREVATAWESTRIKSKRKRGIWVDALSRDRIGSGHSYSGMVQVSIGNGGVAAFRNAYYYCDNRDCGYYLARLAKLQLVRTTDDPARQAFFETESS